jgi:hypothetical protein
VSDEGQVYSLRSSRVLKPGSTNLGHRQVGLCRNGKRRPRYVHHLVLEAFIGPCPPGLECLHANDQAGDNRLENLRWGTRGENLIEAVANGRHPHANKTYCPKRHEYTDENTLWMSTPEGGKYRRCKECNRQWRRNWRAKKAN